MLTGGRGPDGGATGVVTEPAQLPLFISENGAPGPSHCVAGESQMRSFAKSLGLESTVKHWTLLVPDLPGFLWLNIASSHDTGSAGQSPQMTSMLSKL